ncbi:MAG TPA: CocE/NonD family hydrolase [Frankiaceae bacterium]|jgi:X-Pro dipeptidyl-peptidase|nr:CocE/NonD family hydrolase [Frankiaceae bacterium]
MRRLLPAVTAAVVLLGIVTSDAAPARGTRATDEFNAKTPPQTPGLPDLDRIDPVRYSYKDAVRESVQVTARDGVNQIWVDLIRPKTPAGVRVPTILMASPYFNTLGRGYKGECKTPTQSPPGGLPGSPGGTGISACDEHQTPYPEWYDEYFVPRGYAFAAMDLRGTRNTSGCQTYGDRDEVFDAVDVVDWLSSQKWSNGKVGMTGGSYDGTIAMGAAVEQPISGKNKSALAAVIPIRAIDAWYDYHFMNGVESTGHLATPANFTAVMAATDVQNSGTKDPLYPAHVAERRACIATLGAVAAGGYAPPYQSANSPHWAERDFRKDAGGTRAATFLIHGLFDFNVKTSNVGNMWLSLPRGLPKKLWLLNGDHVDPRCPTEETCAASGHTIPHPLADKFIEANHRWWLQFLKGKQAGALARPVEVQQARGNWVSGTSYPASRSDLVLYPAPDGSLGNRPVGEADTVQWADNAAGAGAPRSVQFVTAPFGRTTRLSGQVQLDLKVSATGPDTSIAVRIDDLGPDAEDTDTPDDNLYDGDDRGVLTVTYAWLQAIVRDSVKPRGPSTPVIGTPLQPNTPVLMRFPSLYTDYVVPKGHRLRFTFSNATGGSLASNAGGVVSLAVGPKASVIRLPVVR